MAEGSTTNTVTKGNTTPTSAIDQAKFKKAVDDMLDDKGFDLPVDFDNDGNTASVPGDTKVFYDNSKKRISEVEKLVYTEIVKTFKTATTKSVNDLVIDNYKQKKQEAFDKKWTKSFAVLFVPQNTFYQNHNQLGWNHGIQLQGGATYRLHNAGASGWELALQGSLSFFNFATPQKSTVDDWFQNAMLSIQLQYVKNLGDAFTLGSMQSNFQLVGYGQLAGGLGSNWDYNPSDIKQKNRTLYLGVLGQGTVGTQINWNIGNFQILLSGALVGSVLSPNTQPGSKTTVSVGGQAGFGLGYQW